jgi:putative membrane protein
MSRVILRWIINAIALYAAVMVVNNTIGGISLQNPSLVSYIWMALIFGFVNALLRPLLKLLTCPLILLTLGLFTLIINTFLFYLVGYVGTWFGVGFSVENFWTALLGSLVVSLVSIALSLFVKDERRKARKH